MTPLFPLEPPAPLTPVFIPRSFSSTESLRQLSQQLNGLVSEVPPTWSPEGAREGRKRWQKGTEAEIPKAEGRSWERPAWLDDV